MITQLQLKERGAFHFDTCSLKIILHHPHGGLSNILSHQKENSKKYTQEEKLNTKSSDHFGMIKCL